MPHVCPECRCFTSETRQAADGEIYCLDCATLVDDRLRSPFDATPPRKMFGKDTGTWEGPVTRALILLDFGTG